MKSVLSILSLSLLFVACQPPAEEFAIPEELEAKRALLRTLQGERKTVNDQIAELESAIIAQDPAAKAKGALVTTQAVARGTFSSYITIQGSVMADNLASASAELPGRILSLRVKEGDNVRKGQLIATIDVESIEKQKAELETSLELATTVYERQKRLWDQNIGSEIQYLQAKNSKERLEKSLEVIGVQLTKNNVYAPIGGVVEREVLQAGELASPGLPIVQILNTSNLKVVADVPENYINIVNRGKKVEVGVPALEMSRMASISLIGRTVDPANRTFPVEVNLPQDRRLKPNLLAEMKIKDYEATDVVIIPLNLVQQEVSGERYVLIAANGEEGTEARKVAVEIGESYGGDVVITNGLKGGENLIVDGARGLTEGQLIEINNSKVAK